jgi:hypothetical protein
MRPDAVTDHRDGGGGLCGPAGRGKRKRTAQQAEPNEEKRRESKFAQVIHAANVKWPVREAFRRLDAPPIFLSNRHVFHELLVFVPVIAY